MPYILVGIIPVGGDIKLKDQYPLVQSRCHYNVVDVYTVATVIQDYYSDCSVNRDVEYVFPLPPSAAVCAFKAVLDDDRVIKGVVKEKVEAKKEYDQAVAQGKTAGLLQQEHADVFRVSLGNIKPKQKISVHISFVSIIPHDGSSPQTLRITMPTAIAPRYGAVPTDIPWFGNNSQNRFELTVAVQMSKPVTSVSSPSHPIGLTLGCAQKELQGDFEPSKAFVYLGDPAFLDKDIVLVISAQGLDTPRCTVERWLSSDGAEEITDAYALTLVPKFDLPALPCQEYIFLVDRSGSMGTGRMDAVKASLQIMLKSLPSKNTTFNIVSFGSKFTSFSPTSKTYDAESVEKASKHVDRFSSNYGGTELRSALGFAFKSRAAYGKTISEEKIPASVFLLTDGEAWDLRGVMETVTKGVEDAKKEDSLLRTFVLGVGNQVSTAMCEGIARAGKGTAVFVAEGEKPDAKLMSLLKAARGGVIEDLAVDWGVESDSGPSVGTDDEFEMIPPSTNKATTSAPPLPALSLFDDSVPTESTELGPQDVVVNLSPPPDIQQAPKSDKLPIPLYPGFRCSIFAIIKQSSNPGPHPPVVKITGKVLGRDVILELPVVPISVASDAKDAVEGGRLLHTLAAKALIQDWEDKPTTPETKAQIERLGKRYTLASSVTSFLAIDDDSKDELHASPVQIQENEVTDVKQVYHRRRMSSRPSTSTGHPNTTMPSPPQSNYFTLEDDQSASIPQTHAFSQATPTGVFASAAPTPPPRSSGGGMKGLKKASLRRSRKSYMDDNDVTETTGLPSSGTVPARKRSKRSKMTTTFSSSNQPLLDLDLDAAMDLDLDFADGDEDDSMEPTQSHADTDLGSTIAHYRKRPSKPLTIEQLARAQNFDGSFPSSQQYISSLSLHGRQMPPLPSGLTNLAGDAGVKVAIWATILTLACLQNAFSGDKDAWEMMAEKATEFIEGALQGLGVGDVQQMIADLKGAAIAVN